MTPSLHKIITEEILLATTRNPGRLTNGRNPRGQPKTFKNRPGPTERNNAIFDHWLAGETITKIAKRTHLHHTVIADIVKFVGTSRLETTQILEQPPIYNVWNYGNCDPRFGQKHPGQIPGQAIVNLLLWLTEPFEVVVDPMAGGGTTIDVCRYLLRRYYCFDIDPRRPDIYWWCTSPALSEFRQSCY